MFDVPAFGALIKRKRGEAKLTQETLALDVFGDPTRKADISRIENGKKGTPQEATVQKLCTALDISVAEMEPIRQSRPTAAQLDQIPTLSRDALQTLAARFGIDGAFDLPDDQLRHLLRLKADEHRDLIKEIASLKGLSARIDNIHAAALHAAETFNYDEANQLIEDAREIHSAEILRPALETNARLLETQAEIALMRGDADAALNVLRIAADSFATLDGTEPARRRIHTYFKVLYNHGLRYGGQGLCGAEHLLTDVLQNDELRNRDPWLWAAGQNNFAITIEAQGTRTDGPKGADLLAQAVTAYRAALEVYTRQEHPVHWAGTQNNLGIALENQGTRTDGPKGADLLAQAVTAYRAALEVRTRQEHPVDWAMTQNNLAETLKDKAAHDSCTDPAGELTDALATVDAALAVFDPEHMSFNHAKATRLRDAILADIAKLS